MKTWANSTIGSESVLDKAYDTCNDAVTSGLKKLVELGLLSSALDKRQSDAVDSRNMMSVEDTIAQINDADTEEGSNTLLDESADYTIIAYSECPTPTPAYSPTAAAATSPVVAENQWRWQRQPSSALGQQHRACAGTKRFVRP